MIRPVSRPTDLVQMRHQELAREALARAVAAARAQHPSVLGPQEVER